MDKQNENYKAIIHSLSERQKELNCLYTISRILKTADGTTEELLKQVIDILPVGYQFPEICKVQIKLKDVVVQHDDLVVTELRQTTPIMMDGKEMGEINVYYVKPVKSDIHKIFLYEEQKLIDSVADEIGQYLIVKYYRDFFRSAKSTSAQLNIPLDFSHWLTQWRLTEHQVQKILTNKVTFQPNELILKQGTQISYFLILTKGLIKLSVGDVGARNFIFKIAKPFGFISFPFQTLNAYWQYTASAITKSEAYLVDASVFRSIARDNMEFNNKMVENYDKHLGLLCSKLNLVANKQAIGRVASTLIYLWEDIFEKGIIDNSITRRILAELSSMSTENAVRILSEFRNDKLISTTKKGIKILNPKMLHTYSIAG